MIENKPFHDSRQRSPHIDFAWMIHDVKEVIPHEPGTLFKEMVQQRLEESKGLKTETGNPMKVVCFLESFGVSTKVAAKIGKYSRQGLTPLESIICGAWNVDPSDIGRNSLEWQDALFDANQTVHPDFMQNIQIATELYEKYDKRVLLAVEGNPSSFIDQVWIETEKKGTRLIFDVDKEEAYAALENNDWENALEKYKRSITIEHASCSVREAGYRKKINKLQEDPSVYAIITNIGAIHKSLAASIEEDGFKTEGQEELDPINKQIYPVESEADAIKLILHRTHGDISQISETDLWKSLIIDFMALYAIDDTLLTKENALRIIKDTKERLRNEVAVAFQTMADIKEWQGEMEEDIFQSIPTIYQNFVTKKREERQSVDHKK